MVVPETKCFKCGREVTGLMVSCPACGVCLLVDLLIAEEVVDSRAIYLAAKEIDELGGNAPTFKEVKSNLERLPGTVAGDCSRTLARFMVAALSRQGIPVKVVPVRRPRRKGGIGGTCDTVRRLTPVAKLGLAGSAGALALVMMLYLGSAPIDRTPPPNGVGIDGQALTIRDIIAMTIQSSAQLRCSDSAGAGFFIGPQQLVTNAHVLCKDNEPIEVILSNQLVMTGAPVRQDDWLDLAIVQVPGAQTLPLELGDATLVEQGQPILAIGTPHGPELSVAQGVVSHPSHYLFGVSYLRVDAGIYPGVSGGPILDRSGKVVAVAATAVAGSSTQMLAIPINYLYSGRESFFPRELDQDELKRWRQVQFNARAKEEAALAELRSSPNRPALVGAALIPPGLVQTVIVRFGSNRSGSDEFHFELFGDHQDLCSPTGKVHQWLPIGESSELVKSNRFVRWLARHSLTGSLYAGSSNLDLQGCPGPDSVLGSELVLTGASPWADRSIIREACDS